MIRIQHYFHPGLKVLAQVLSLVYHPRTFSLSNRLMMTSLPWDRPNLSIHLENWKSAEDRPELVDELVQDELDKGWIYRFNGSVEDARAAFPLGLAIGKLGLAITDSRPPRLVVDSTVCGTNGNCRVNEHQCMPSSELSHSQQQP